MILRNQATGVSNAFPHFSPFFFFIVTRNTRPTLKRCYVKIDDSMFEGVILEIVNIVQPSPSVRVEPLTSENRKLILLGIAIKEIG